MANVKVVTIGKAIYEHGEVMEQTVFGIKDGRGVLEKMEFLQGNR